MRDLFPGFYKRSNLELSKMWQEGIFVFDTNMLLNVYRYSPETRDRFFDILTRLKDQIWMPYQVGYEYQENRISVISEQINAYNQVIRLLESTLENLKNGLEPFKKRHAFIDPIQLMEGIKTEVDQAKSQVQRRKRNHPNYKDDDHLREKLDVLYTGKLGIPYSKEDIEIKYRLAEQRVERRIPPGFKDEGKTGVGKYGDIILWFQMLDYARDQKKPIIFITDDAKKDWWLTSQESRGPLRPRPELVQEMFTDAGVLFHMYQGYEFMEQSQKFLKLEEKPQIIEEAKEVAEQNVVDANQMKRRKPRTFDEFFNNAKQAEIAVRNWLESNFFEENVVENPGSPDFIISEPDGKMTGVEVKYVGVPVAHQVVKTVIEQFGLLNILQHEQRIDNLIIFVVCVNLMEAIKVSDVIEKMVDVPVNIRVIIGHLHFNDFLTVKEIP